MLALQACHTILELAHIASRLLLVWNHHFRYPRVFFHVIHLKLHVITGTRHRRQFDLMAGPVHNIMQEILCFFFHFFHHFHLLSRILPFAKI